MVRKGRGRARGQASKARREVVVRVRRTRMDCVERLANRCGQKKVLVGEDRVGNPYLQRPSERILHCDNRDD